MTNENSLERFIEAQERDYTIALSEIKNGRKRSHWMWYIFPQIEGLGYSAMSKYYSIKNLDEAAGYLQHPVLSKRLLETSNELLKLNETNAGKIFGSPDDMKLKSSMTLFASVPDADIVFQSVLDKFFDSAKDEVTLKKLNV